MKSFVKPKCFPWLPLAAGLIGLILRIWIYSDIDSKGLLPTGHIGITLIFILTALVMAVLFLCVRRFHPDGRCGDCFPRSVAGGLGNLIAALGIALFSLLEAAVKIEGFLWITFPAGLLAAIALVGCAVARFRGRRPAFFLYVIVCLYLMLHAVSQCRIWGAEPQLFNYCFQLLASIFLLLAAYQYCAVSIDKANCRWLLYTSQAALFFCCLCLNTESSLFYLAMAIWMAADLCKLREA